MGTYSWGDSVWLSVEMVIIRLAIQSVRRAGISVCYAWGGTIAAFAARGTSCREGIVWVSVERHISRV
jgi:hypothetical protein